MQEAIIKYLQKKAVPVSAVEIVEQILKIKTGDAEMAAAILRGLFKDSSPVCMNNNGMLSLKQDTGQTQAEQQAVCLCQVFPVRAPLFFSGASLFCARFVASEQVSRLVIHSDEFARGNDGDAARARFAQLVEMIRNTPLIFDGLGNQISVFRRAVLQVTGMELDTPVISLYRLAKKLNPGSVIRNAAQLSAVLGEQVYQDSAPELHFAAFIEQYKNILSRCRNLGKTGIAELLSMQSSDKNNVSFDGYAFDEIFLANLPESAGVYMMKNNAGQVIYVGKSKNLRRRLRSYFLEMERPGEKLEKIRDRVYEIVITLTGSELEALLLEQQLIDEYHPQINKQVKVHERDGKASQLYARIILLPGVVPDTICLYFIKPGQDYERLDYKADGSGMKEFRRRAELFFNSGISVASDNRQAILASWLCQNDDKVNSIDMRKYANMHDVERLVKDYAASMQVENSRVVHY